jgi:hypothetical protein
MAARATCSQELSFRDEGKLCHACLKRTTADNTYTTDKGSKRDWASRAWAS